MSDHDELDPKEEVRLIENYKQIIASYESAKSKDSIPKEGSFKGLKGNFSKDWEKQIQQMKARVERFKRENGKKGRHQHR